MRKARAYYGALLFFKLKNHCILENKNGQGKIGLSGYWMELKKYIHVKVLRFESVDR